MLNATVNWINLMVYEESDEVVRICNFKIHNIDKFLTWVCIWHHVKLQDAPQCYSPGPLFGEGDECLQTIVYCGVQTFLYNVQTFQCDVQTVRWAVTTVQCSEPTVKLIIQSWQYIVQSLPCRVQSVQCAVIISLVLVYQQREISSESSTPLTKGINKNP